MLNQEKSQTKIALYMYYNHNIRFKLIGEQRRMNY